MTEIPATYDCGLTCSCDAVQELAHERTELMEEVIAGVERARGLLARTRTVGCPERKRRQLALDAENVLLTVLAKYRGEEGGDHAGG